jgi:hypothetical protein
MTVSDALQLAAMATTFFSTWQVGNRSLSGPVWGLISNACWLALELYLGLYLLVPVPIVMSLLHLRTYRLWRAAA